MSFIDFSFSSQSLFQNFLIYYSFVLGVYYIFSQETSKARIILGYLFSKVFLRKKISFSNIHKQAFLSWAVKIFFAPLMIFWLTGHVVDLSNNIFLFLENREIFSSDFLLFFNSYFFYTFFSLILFFDVLFFTLGYLVEGKIFKNKIISVDPTLLGWVVTLLAYPPFNNISNTFLSWYSTDFPQFGNMYFHIFFNIIILILMGIYSRASISLGGKASNLTYRGTVKKGPYKYMRHPAYVTKNLAWWIGGLPILISSILAFEIKIFLLALFSLIGRSFLYYLRAITEEKHLSQFEDYQQYQKEVGNKFFPYTKKNTH